MVNLESKLIELIEFAESLGFEVRSAVATGTSEHPGGAMIRLGRREIILLEPQASVPDQIGVVAAAIAKKPETEEIFLTPDLREIIDSYADVELD